MNTFYDLKIAEITKMTQDCVALTFEVPENLRKIFAYKQGQYLTLKKNIEGQEVRRNYSLCSSPIENLWKVAIKQINGGVFSTYANTQLQKEEVLQVLPAQGDFFTAIEKKESKNYILFAAGSGITPILSILKTHLALEPDSHFKLFYVNRTAKSILFKEELEALRNTYFGRVELFYFLTRETRDIPLLNGRITNEKLKELANAVISIDHTDECFICGPEEMILQIKEGLIEEGMKEENIHYELFFSGASEQVKKQAEEVVSHKFDGTEVTIIDGGKEFHFHMLDDYDTILDGALAAGVDLPYACKGGVCSTCKCKVIDGKVEMKINYALEEAEVNKGLVLSCQAVPTTDKVVVDFDV